MKISVTGL